MANKQFIRAALIATCLMPGSTLHAQRLNPVAMSATPAQSSRMTAADVRAEKQCPATRLVGLVAGPMLGSLIGYEAYNTIEIHLFEPFDSERYERRRRHGRQRGTIIGSVAGVLWLFLVPCSVESP